MSARHPLVALAALAVIAGCGAPVLELMSATPRSATEMEIGGSTLRVEVVERGDAVTAAAFEAWVRRAAQMVADFCGGFPVPELRVRVLTGTFGGVGFGQHYMGERVSVIVGESVTRESLERDWVMVHEMLHAAFPRLAGRHRWMQEGLSTYLQIVVRARAGVLTDEEAWRKILRRMPTGLPRDGDRGLDHTHTWARTYWGGALFWFLVDVDLLEQTDTQRSVRDVMRGVLGAGGNARQRWTSARVVAEGDRATGTTVLAHRYRTMARAPGTVDLDALFSRLGVSLDESGEVRFDDAAELADVRRALTRPMGTTLPPVPE